MARLLALVGLAAGAVAALLLWASARDLREPWRWPAIPAPEPDDDMAGVQVDLRPHEVQGTWEETEPGVSWPDLPPARDYERTFRTAYANPIGGM